MENPMSQQFIRITENQSWLQVEQQLSFSLKLALYYWLGMSCSYFITSPKRCQWCVVLYFKVKLAEREEERKQKLSLLPGCLKCGPGAICGPPNDFDWTILTHEHALIQDDLAIWCLKAKKNPKQKKQKKSFKIRTKPEKGCVLT